MTGHRNARREPGTVAMLAAILEHRPHLPNAACRGQFALFDHVLHPEGRNNNTPAQIAAERLCRHCPHTNACPDTLARPQEKTA
ncbi:hypothetical protein [Rhodococcus marinonascens]|uniref:hypothetical protein n=1 Tax=Rhodococcus marinonascens TaxID=38311 RepID=UPI000935346D|nr:hypothetical protein [Rhodococcus marinonascens]